MSKRDPIAHFIDELANDALATVSGGKQLPARDHQFSDPTARGDLIAEKVRSWYEANRETWWDRHRPNAARKGGVADNFMLGLIGAVHRAEND